MPRRGGGRLSYQAGESLPHDGSGHEAAGAIDVLILLTSGAGCNLPEYMRIVFRVNFINKRGVAVTS